VLVDAIIMLQDATETVFDTVATRLEQDEDGLFNPKDIVLQTPAVPTETIIGGPRIIPPLTIRVFLPALDMLIGDLPPAGSNIQLSAGLLATNHPTPTDEEDDEDGTE